MQPPKYKSYLLSLLLDRIYKHNKNNVILISGEPGDGKSYAGLFLGEKLSPERFDINNVISEPGEFTVFMSAEKRAEIQRGDIILWDECSVGLSSKNWYSLLNKSINFILQTFRSKGITLIFTTPYQVFLDSDARRLINFLFVVDKIDRKRKMSILRPYRVSIDAKTRKIYYKYPVNKMTNEKVTKFMCGLPSKKLIEDYEEKKAQFQHKLYDDIHEDIRRIDLLHAITMKPEDIEIYKKLSMGAKQTVLAKRYNKTQATISRIYKKGRIYFKDTE